MSYISQSLISLKKVVYATEGYRHRQEKGVSENKGSGALRVMLSHLMPCRPTTTPGNNLFQLAFLN